MEGREGVRGPGKGGHGGQGGGLHIKVVSGGWRLGTALQEGIVHSPKGMDMNVCVCVCEGG